MKQRISRKIIPVILRCKAQEKQVDRLVDYCRELDGTQVQVIEADYTAPVKPHTQAAADAGLAGFFQAVKTFNGRPFFWLETDSIPLQAGWLQKLTREYWRISVRKPFMLSSDCAPPAILVGGIGVYGPEASWLLPTSYPPKVNWDSWITRTIPHAVHFTPLIQHRYCAEHKPEAPDYDTIRENKFPEDAKILRPDALIFHADKAQSLMLSENRVPMTGTGRIFRHSGDIGDLISSLPILRALGGGKVILFHDPEAPPGMAARESMEGKRFESIKPLLEAQPYVESVSWGKNISIREHSFREVMRPKFESLLERQARHVGMWPIDTSPWLTVPGEVEKHDRIVCARSSRYHNTDFPWRDVSETYGDRILFIGLEDEHENFERAVMRRVEWAKTENFLDIARIMAGAPQVICNQSSPAWVALGLGVKMILEGSAAFPNTELPRKQNFYAYTPEHMVTLRRAFHNARLRRTA